METKRRMKVVFVSNYLNRHQQFFCQEMYERLQGQFRFIQTEPMTKERTELGWQLEHTFDFVLDFSKREEESKHWIMESDAVLIGGTSDQYIQERLDAGKLVFRIEENIFKNGWRDVFNIHKWNMIRKCHFRYRNRPVYMLCASANLEKELSELGLYKGKRFPWGYFPETKEYDVVELLERKHSEYTKTGRIELVWCGRFIWWKHPEYIIYLARHWRNSKLPVHITMIGTGVKYKEIERTIRNEKLESYITLTGAVPQEQVRSYMEKAFVFLGTSGREEGWGAVLNEAMNSACIACVNRKMGAAGYLIENGINGYIYNSLDECEKQLEQITDAVGKNEDFREKEYRRMASEAYYTIRDTWNAEKAAEWLINKIKELQK